MADGQGVRVLYCNTQYYCKYCNTQYPTLNTAVFPHNGRDTGREVMAMMVDGRDLSICPDAVAGAVAGVPVP